LFSAGAVDIKRALASLASVRATMKKTEVRDSTSEHKNGQFLQRNAGHKDGCRIIIAGNNPTARLSARSASGTEHFVSALVTRFVNKFGCLFANCAEGRETKCRRLSCDTISRNTAPL